MDARKVIVALVLASGLGGVEAHGQDVSAQIPAASRYRYRLLGVYDKDSGDPVEGVEIVDILTGTKTTTNKSGVISLFFLPEGGSLVRFRKPGYELQTMPISISPNDTLPVTVVLSRATQLPAMVVTDSSRQAISGNLRAFDERSKQGFGRFITTAELRKNDDRSMALVIPAHIPGLMSIPKNKNGTETYLVTTRKVCTGLAIMAKCNGFSCPVQVYIDDAILPSPVDAAQLRTEDFAGVEYYAGGGSMPVKYNRTGADCGVLLLWTRER